MVNAIELKSASSDSYINEYGDVLKILPNVKHINLFIGENNSGKSRLMRSLVNSNDALILVDEINASAVIELNSIRNNLKDIVERAQTECQGISLSEQHNEMSAADLYAYYNTHFQGVKLFETAFKYPNNDIPKEVKTALNSLYRILMQKADRQRDDLILKSCPIAYIPVLRGVESFNLYFDTKKDRELEFCLHE